MTAYYNEHDPKAAAWIRELIKAGAIAPGEVDERSIVDVKPVELIGYTQCHFFAGIGGWSYALRLAGWPDSKPVWTGSCPCQPFSVAGVGEGNNDPRSLWWAFRWLIQNCRPSEVFGEQVAGKAGRSWLAGVRADLEALGYAVGAADLCAAGVSAPHPRQRLFWVADSDEQHGNGAGSSSGDNCGEKLAEGSVCGIENISAGRLGLPDGARRDEGWLTASTARYGRSFEPAGGPCGMGDAYGSGCREQCGTEPVGAQFVASECASVWNDYDLIPCADGKTRRIKSRLLPLVNGVSRRMGLIRGYGNAIVPQIAAEFIKACEEAGER